MFCGYETYDEYLLSPEWRAKREKVLDEQGRMCCICGSTDNIHVHHTKYEEIDGVDVSPCRVLCGECHKKIHASSDYINGRFGVAIAGLWDAIIANTMLVLWKGEIPLGNTTRLKGLLLAEYERNGKHGCPTGVFAPAIYKSKHCSRQPDKQFQEVFDNATKVWNLYEGEGK